MIKPVDALSRQKRDPIGLIVTIAVCASIVGCSLALDMVVGHRGWFAYLALPFIVGAATAIHRRRVNSGHLDPPHAPSGGALAGHGPRAWPGVPTPHIYQVQRCSASQQQHGELRIYTDQLRFDPEGDETQHEGAWVAPLDQIAGVTAHNRYFFFGLVPSSRRYLTVILNDGAKADFRLYKAGKLLDTITTVTAARQSNEM